MLGFKTIGNATLVAFDEVPVIATDPWFGEEDEAYFGSWRLSHEIPADVQGETLSAKFIWFSHGHPDHLNPHSKKRFRGKKILLPDHVGGRIAQDLEAQQYDVTVLPDREWVTLSNRIKILCITDYLQDAILLLDINGRLVINVNDAGIRGCLRFLRGIVRRYDNSYLLKLAGYGDADMINFFDESGQRIERIPDALVGQSLSGRAKMVGARNVIPFSSFHEYQRSDSKWANRHTTPLEAYARGFDEKNSHLIEPFVFVDCNNDSWSPIRPARIPERILEPEQFGDNWSDELEPSDRRLLTDYFTRKELLHQYFGFLRFRVGGQDFIVELTGPKDTGITFECPRGSLVTAVQFEFFDDLLIGNFMKTTLHGVRSLYDPDFGGIVTRFADQGGAQSDADVREYLAAYKRRAGLELIQFLIEQKAVTTVRRYVHRGTPGWNLAKSIYFGLKSS